MRGDELCPRPLLSMTRSIRIDAPPEDVWPWVAQIGQNRGGFYSFSWFENLFGARIVNADRVVPEFQITGPGDTVSIHPKQPPFEAVEVDAPRALVLYGRGGLVALTSWTLELRDDGGATELSARMRIDRGDRGPIGALLRRVLLNLLLRPGHALMERQMLRGIRRRAERAVPARNPDA
ncbi:MAG: SRPBCC family protein [Planctomycetota bacterium]